ncbi:hypothetical protein, partial [Acinetobacter bereziniae]|uniref:hypothetical protein n=1 Tax=Acinetobacter bereziniae TaxID=106648 RepID=UPI001D0E029C
QYGNTFIIMNDHICQLMVNHLNLNNDKDFAFLLIKSIKNGSITLYSWEIIKINTSKNSADAKKIKEVFKSLTSLYLSISQSYYNKILPHLNSLPLIMVFLSFE